MCKASMNARHVREAKLGDTLVFDQSPHGLPMVRRSEDASDCPTCLKMGRRITVINIPPALQDSLEIGEMVDAVFVEEIDDTSDRLRLSDGRDIDMFSFLSICDPASMRVIVGEELAESDRQQLVDILSGRSDAPVMRQMVPA